MNYDEAVQYIHNTLKFGSKLGLQNITELLRRLGDPHKEFPSVHIAGTNGKGSVTAMTTSILKQAGYRVGMFISPYLERFTERIQVNLEEIPREELAALTEIVKEQVEGMVKDGFHHPTEFEVVTALGFLWFARQKVDIAVVEVGLGGRLDSTNVITPVVSVITSISYDHMRVLGNTLAEIAFEKGGIMKPGVPVVSYPQPKDAEQVLRDLAARRGCPYYEVSPDQIQERDSAISVQHFHFFLPGRKLENLAIHLTGKHQLLNAACALTAVEVLKEKGFPINDEAVYGGLDQARWPGRLEVIRQNPTILLDGAHNPAGAQTLVDAVKLYFPRATVCLMLGVLQDKDVNEITGILCSVADKVLVTRSDNPRFTPPEELAETVKKYHSNVIVSPGLKEALKLALDWLESDDGKKDGQNIHIRHSEDKVLIISGSLYLIGEARTLLIQMTK